MLRNMLSTKLSLTAILAFAPLCASAQRTAAPAPPKPTAPAPEPSTKLEGFKPAQGSVVVLGFKEFGSLRGVTVQAQQVKDTRGHEAHGLVVEVKEGEYRDERAYIDADEIPDLLKGFDYLLSVTSNPTPFKMFEVRYKTRGSLQLTAFSDDHGNIMFAVEAGSVTKAGHYTFTSADMQQVRAMVAEAQNALGTLGSS
jgi:hypothetical protein